jgi:RNA polymerase sigma factor (TIGR02999 family)
VVFAIRPSSPVKAGRAGENWQPFGAYRKIRAIPITKSSSDVTATGSDLTGLLLAWGDGDPTALERLTPKVYQELRRLARRYMAAEPVGHTLQATALVSEVYLRLVDIRRIKWQNRAHFYAMSARLIRRILVDFARSRRYQKRGGGAQKVSLDEAMAIEVSNPGLVALDDALKLLAKTDERRAKVVEMRFFGGLTVEETAAALNVSVDTVMRDWKAAKTWLYKQLKDSR